MVLNSFCFLLFRQCSAGCGFGVQSRSVTCRHRLTGKTGNTVTCNAGSRPTSTRRCKLKECKKIGRCFQFSHGVPQTRVFLRPYHTEYDHERERDQERECSVRIRLSISNLCESVYTKGYHKHGWRLVRAQSRKECV